MHFDYVSGKHYVHRGCGAVDGASIDGCGYDHESPQWKVGTYKLLIMKYIATM